MEALRAYIRADRPFFGICIGMQSLFEGSDESPSFEGLGIIPGRVTRFNSVGAQGETVRVPQMGWNGVSPVRESVVFEEVNPQDAVRYYLLIADEFTSDLTVWFAILFFSFLTLPFVTSLGLFCALFLCEANA